MFNVSRSTNNQIYNVYDIRVVEDKTYFLVFESIDKIIPPGMHLGWNWEDSSLFIPTSLK